MLASPLTSIFAEPKSHSLTTWELGSSSRFCGFMSRWQISSWGSGVWGMGREEVEREGIKGQYSGSVPDPQLPRCQIAGGGKIHLTGMRRRIHVSYEEEDTCVI